MRALRVRPRRGAAADLQLSRMLGGAALLVDDVVLLRQESVQAVSVRILGVLTRPAMRPVDVVVKETGLKGLEGVELQLVTAGDILAVFSVGAVDLVAAMIEAGLPMAHVLTRAVERTT